MDWDKLRIFHAVASAGSFTHAGQMLTLSQSAVSRQISALEEEIATPLFQRHARGLTLTDEGEMLYGAVSDVLARLVSVEEALKDSRAARHSESHLQPRHRHLLAAAAPQRLFAGISGSGCPYRDGRSRTGSRPARSGSGLAHARAGAGGPDPA